MMEMWQDGLVVLSLVAAGFYVAWRLRRAVRPDSPPTCASCDRCPGVQRQSDNAPLVSLHHGPSVDSSCSSASSRTSCVE